MLVPIKFEFFPPVKSLNSLKIRKDKKIDKSAKLIIKRIWIFKGLSSRNPFPAKVWIVKKPTNKDKKVINPIR